MGAAACWPLDFLSAASATDVKIRGLKTDLVHMTLETVATLVAHTMANSTASYTIEIQLQARMH